MISFLMETKQPSKKVLVSLETEAPIFKKKVAIIRLLASKKQGFALTQKSITTLNGYVEKEIRIFHKDFKLSRTAIKQSKNSIKSIEAALSSDVRLKQEIQQKLSRSNTTPDTFKLKNTFSKINRIGEAEKRELAEDLVLEKLEREANELLDELRKNLEEQQHIIQNFTSSFSSQEIAQLRKLLKKQISIYNSLKHHEEIAYKIEIDESHLTQFTERLAPKLHKAHKNHKIFTIAFIIFALALMLFLSNCSTFNSLVPVSVPKLSESTLQTLAPQEKRAINSLEEHISLGFRAPRGAGEAAHRIHIRKSLESLERYRTRVAVPFIRVILLRDSDDTLRTKAAVVLGTIGGPKAEDALIDALGEKDIWAFASIVDKLVLLKREKAVPHLIGLLKNDDPTKVNYVIPILSDLGDKRAIEPLEELQSNLDKKRGSSWNQLHIDINNKIIKALKKLKNG
jgi:hypothetical protein